VTDAQFKKEAKDRKELMNVEIQPSSLE